ncbi:type VII secretion protein EsaA [Oceanobacillus manasiensis]|uniref:type VII secretion protein EsaA n=1 Tax=Oceanobacillus manasiensis TaxID=586413 RepID=UPI0005A70E26|nr:type VII secretion protein EsaA [Oceanobacillus manasiensis]
MKKSILQLSFFLLLILTLVFGLSFISLDRNTTQEEDTKEERMSIALVNEDNGTTFDGVGLDFGDTFVKSINQNNHDWYVVSRGVAESGLERNTYDMMIVIPQDFSEKALSIDSESPEHVVLNYKINASDSELIRANAEETASNILNDFNRRIIDVYFASVIGNLQNAQDDVAEFVEEYEKLTYTYNHNVHAPLSGYTDQFSMVKDNTEMSKTYFNGFENTLGSYEENLVEQLNGFENYQSNIEDVADTKQSNSVLVNDFADQLSSFQNSLNSGDMNSQLQSLQDSNDFINAQFRLNKENEGDLIDNIAFHTRGLQNRLLNLLGEIEMEQESFDIETVNNKVREQLAANISDAFDGNDQMTALLVIQEDRLLDEIEKQISQLPSLDEGALEGSDLSPEMIREIQNVMKVTKKYNDEWKNVHSTNRDLILPEHIQALKENLNRQGVTLTETVQLPESEKPLREFKVTDIPDGFTVSKLSLQLEGGEEQTFYRYKENDVIELPTYQSGKFTVTLTLRLKDEYLAKPLDVYDIKQWKWELYQVDKADADQSNPDEAVEEEPKVKNPDPLVSRSKSDKTKNDLGIINVTNNEDTNNEEEPVTESDDENNDTNDQDNNQDDTTENENGQDNSNEDTEEENAESNEDEESPGEDGAPGEGSDEEPADGDEPNGGEEDSNHEEEIPDDKDEDQKEIEIVEIDHHYIRHSVKTPVIDEATENLIHAVENTIAPYQQLQSSYEIYFGLDLTCKNVDSKNCGSVSNDKSLAELASNQSLHALFNKDIGELMTDYIANQVIQDVANEIRQPLADYENQLLGYQNYTNETMRQAEELAATVVNTRETARILNENLQSAVENITEWRDQSISLVDSQSEIQNTNESEQTMLMSLSEGFRPVLSQSQALAEQASNNNNEAEAVYQSFDQIEKQADSIQQSGTDLVQGAETLANTMTNKLVSDQDFVENFTNVMANSRIGDRQNEDLYEFLANPVETKNEGVLTESAENFTAYFLVLICFLVALFTSYGISTFNQKRIAENHFEEERSIIGKNGLITGIVASIGVLEGLVLGSVSAYLLDLGGGKLILWIGLMILIMVTLVLVATYLLRQLKMLGMFILLGVLSMYLFFTNALTNSLSGVATWRDYSPLQYVERLLNRVVLGSSDYSFIVLGLIAIAIIALVANLFVITKRSSETTEDDENAA